MKRIHAVAGVLRRGETFLAVRRPEGRVMAGYWEFPGGKIEPGESPAQALARELREELGITVASSAFWRTEDHVYDHGHVTLQVFLVENFSGEPAGMEGQELSWMTPETALTHTFLPADIPLLQDLEENTF